MKKIICVIGQAKNGKMLEQNKQYLRSIQKHVGFLTSWSEPKNFFFEGLKSALGDLTLTAQQCQIIMHCAPAHLHDEIAQFSQPAAGDTSSGLAQLLMHTLWDAARKNWSILGMMNAEDMDENDLNFWLNRAEDKIINMLAILEMQRLNLLILLHNFDDIEAEKSKNEAEEHIETLTQNAEERFHGIIPARLFLMKLLPDTIEEITDLLAALKGVRPQDINRKIECRLNDWSAKDPQNPITGAEFLYPLPEDFYGLPSYRFPRTITTDAQDAADSTPRTGRDAAL